MKVRILKKFQITRCLYILKGQANTFFAIARVRTPTLYYKYLSIISSHTYSILS